jgi:hypothetical protein
VRSKIFWCALGFFAGAVVTDWLASRASVTFAREVLLRHRTEQQLLAACAIQRGDVEEGVLRYGDAVAVVRDAGRTRTAGWPLGFSFAHAALDVLVNQPVLTSTGRRRVQRTSEGHARSVFADALERAGRTSEARAEHLRAARLLDETDVERSRRLGAVQARALTRLARRSDPDGCYFRRSAGTAGVGASSSIR